MYDPSARYELTVCPNGRTQADEYYHQGQVWIEGREGSTYTLRFGNRSQSRVLVIFSVDGLDVLKGQPAGHLSEGYVVNPGSHLEVPGWKVDGSTAAEFFFSKSGKSYVTKMGHNANNTGVIGAMVFEEVQQWLQPAHLTFTSSSLPNTNWSSAVGYNTSDVVSGTLTGSVHPGVPANNVSIIRNASGTTVNHEVGTGFGDAVQWNTVVTTFNRANPTVPNAIMAIYYDSAKGLQRRGIVLKSRYSASASNNPFPAYTSGSGATPPPGWKP